MEWPPKPNLEGRLGFLHAQPLKSAHDGSHCQWCRKSKLDIEAMWARARPKLPYRAVADTPVPYMYAVTGVRPCESYASCCPEQQSVQVLRVLPYSLSQPKMFHSVKCRQPVGPKTIGIRNERSIYVSPKYVCPFFHVDVLVPQI